MVRPILFNGDMVRAILEGRKTVTRRKIDIDISNQFDVEVNGSVICYIDSETGDRYKPEELCRYHPGDILYVRETWNGDWCGHYIYRADGGSAKTAGYSQEPKWRPSIHMPKEAARIWLQVTDVRAERLQDMRPVDAVNEGAYEDCWDCLNTYGESGAQCCYQKEDECSQCDSVMME